MKSLKIPLFLPLGKVAGTLRKWCGSCLQHAAGTNSWEGPQLSISHTYVSWSPVEVLPDYGLSLHTILGDHDAPSPPGPVVWVMLLCIPASPQAGGCGGFGYHRPGPSGMCCTLTAASL